MLAAIGVLLAGGWLSGVFSLMPLELSERALAKHREDEAEQQVAWADWLNADDARTELLRARIARRRSDFERMTEHLERAAAEGADRKQIEHEELLAAAQTGQLDAIEPRLKAWMSDPGDDAIEICEAYSNGLTMVGRLQDAQVVLQAWQADRPEDPEPDYRRGRILEHLLDYEAAEKEYRDALAKDPTYPCVLFALGRLLFDRKQSAEALEFFRSCVQHAPETAPAAEVGIAKCQRALGNIDEARRLLERLVEVKPESRRQAYLRIRHSPLGDPACFELGKLESDEGNFQVGEKWLRKTVEENPQDLDARYAWAVALRGVGRKEDSQREFEHVSKVRKILAETDRLYDRLGEQPDDVEARYKLGMAYLQYRSEKSGLYWLKSVLNYDPQHVPTHAALADYYEKHSDESDAFQQLAIIHRQHAQMPVLTKDSRGR